MQKCPFCQQEVADDHNFSVEDALAAAATFLGKETLKMIRAGNADVEQIRRNCETIAMLYPFF